MESVQRDQSGTYGCRVLDYDAAEEAELSQALELRVACESPGRTWRGVLALAVPSPPPSPSPSPASKCAVPVWIPNASLPLGTLPQSPLNSHTRQPESPFRSTDLTFPLLQNLPWLPSALWESPGASPCPPAWFHLWLTLLPPPRHFPHPTQASLIPMITPCPSTAISDQSLGSVF